MLNRLDSNAMESLKNYSLGNRKLSIDVTSIISEGDYNVLVMVFMFEDFLLNSFAWTFLRSRSYNDIHILHLMSHSDMTWHSEKYVWIRTSPPPKMRAPIICIFREEYGYVKVKVSSFVSNSVRIRFPPTMLLHKAGMVFLSIKETKRKRV